MILFCPESSYNRDALYDLDTNVDENFEQLAALEKKYVKHDGEKGEVVDEAARCAVVAQDGIGVRAGG
jgi:predicted RNase H-like nuclease (RuvC/YqgF family)